MSVELKIELTGAVVYVRQVGIGGEKVVALLLAGGSHAHHMPAHRPNLVFDPTDIESVAGLPAQIIHTAKHKLGLQVDMTGFDLVLGEESATVVVDDGGLPFSRVVSLKDLLPAEANTAVRPALIQRSENPNSKAHPGVVAGRLFLDSGVLYAVGPVAAEQLNVLWRFTYQGDGGDHVKLTTLATDRVAFRCILPGDTLSLASWKADDGAGREATIKCRSSRRIIARLACTPGLPLAAAQAGELLDVATNNSHFEMAYDILTEDPPYKAVPDSSSGEADVRVPGKNCFKAAQIVV